ncbi:MAG: acylphosphatase [Deltaproteobacteria bacterium]|nr:acylphosphatase [Deltaproteobacteria bacterium]
MEEFKRVRVLIEGRVQGVCFRMETRRMAEGIGVKGWVRNLVDGRVEALFEGPSEVVDRAVEWCRKGPALSGVSRVEVHEITGGPEFSSFEITY